ncbi:MAG TPA: hypothetical protein PLC52_07310 [Anaerolineales bacterium]|nr:hypothetical protein [Anaerolineales bacterium]HRQ92658.1 hypothetical protein [Anaerolineales bacterium]
MGFPTHEPGPFFEQLGLFTSWPLIAGFVLPFGPVGGLLRTVATVKSYSSHLA